MPAKLHASPSTVAHINITPAPLMPEDRDAVATEADMLRAETRSAVCVQISVDSRNSAIHNAYRISLRPSSLLEPRHPSLKVLELLC